jgi:transcription elongation factor Elf1
MTRCPFCNHEATRREVHAHLVAEHPEQVHTWTQGAGGRMRYRIACPLCGAEHEARVKPRSQDPNFLEGFAREIRLVAFDMLLCHLEAEHDREAEGAEGARDLPTGPMREEPAELPAAGPGGGRGRPGADGVPLPPGMAEPELPAWMRAVAELKVKQVKPSGREQHDGSAGLRHP